MDHQSRDKKLIPEGYLLGDQAEILRQARLSCKNDVPVRRVKRMKWPVEPSSDAPLLICRSYSEPCCLPGIEEVLLQREYIID